MASNGKDILAAFNPPAGSPCPRTTFAAVAAGTTTTINNTLLSPTIMEIPEGDEGAASPTSPQTPPPAPRNLLRGRRQANPHELYQQQQQGGGNKNNNNKNKNNTTERGSFRTLRNSRRVPINPVEHAMGLTNSMIEEKLRGYYDGLLFLRDHLYDMKTLRQDTMEKIAELNRELGRAYKRLEAQDDEYKKVHAIFQFLNAEKKFQQSMKLFVSEQYKNIPNLERV